MKFLMHSLTVCLSLIAIAIGGVFLWLIAAAHC